jgi:hypothetical protein
MHERADFVASHPDSVPRRVCHPAGAMPRLLTGVLERFRATVKDCIALRNVHWGSSLTSVHANAPAATGH